MPRSLKRPWLDEYVDDVAKSAQSPRRYHWWSGATIIASTLKRHVWIDRVKWRLFPNLYTVLVGRPGIGKGAAVNPAINLLRKANTANILSDRLTIEFVLERLSKGFTAVQHTGSGMSFGTDSSCVIFTPEFKNFMLASVHTSSNLADLWDARPGDTMYGTRGKGELLIKDPCPCMLGASAPEWMARAIQSEDISGGFTRRVNFVFAKDVEKFIPWPVPQNGSGQLEQELVEDLRRIAALHGEFKFDASIRNDVETYYLSAIPQDFDDEATANYVASKWFHAAKLSMALSASRGDDLVIRREDWEDAVREVDFVIQDLKSVFRAVGHSDLVEAADKVLRFVELRGFVSRNEVIHACWRDATALEIDVILTTFREAGMLAETQMGNKIMYKSAAAKSKAATP